MAEFHGLALVKKPAGVTSHDVVSRARRVFHTPSVGHCGTLDPMATGLLILLVGEATKISQFILEGDKSYRVSLVFGKETDTLDITGQVLNTSDKRVSADEIASSAQKLSGSFLWPVPRYSAKKMDGKKLYEYAREGISVDIPTKDMKFWDVRCLLVDPAGTEAHFELSCSKGSFIRTWVDQLGQSLGCGATMSALERTRSVPFCVENACSLEEISEGLNHPSELSCLIPLHLAFPTQKRIRIKGLDQHLFRNGQISHDLRARLIHVFNPRLDQIVVIQSQEGDRILGLVGVEPNKGFVVRRVFNGP